jgi:hypothetical protein
MDKAYIVHERDIPTCNFCDRKAQYDAKTNQGPWANMCHDHYVMHRAYSTLGTGKGQEYVVGEPPKKSSMREAREFQRAVEAGNFDLAEELLGDF